MLARSEDTMLPPLLPTVLATCASSAVLTLYVYGGQGKPAVPPQQLVILVSSARMPLLQAHHRACIGSGHRTTVLQMR